MDAPLYLLSLFLSTDSSGQYYLLCCTVGYLGLDLLLLSISLPDELSWSNQEIRVARKESVGSIRISATRESEHTQ